MYFEHRKLLNSHGTACMSFVISSLLPFPNIYWWMQALKAEKIVFDIGEHYEKMSFRNRYIIAGGNGLVRLSIPLQAGRDQRTAMHEVAIANKEQWQQNHWRTLVSAYSRAPYWEYYAPLLQDLYHKQYTLLTDFNAASMAFITQQLKLELNVETSKQYIEANKVAIDMRPIKPAAIINGTFHNYHQVFAERLGFLPNLSILDLLFAEGPYAKQLLH